VSPCDRDSAWPRSNPSDRRSGSNAPVHFFPKPTFETDFLIAPSAIGQLANGRKERIRGDFLARRLVGLNSHWELVT